MLADTKKEVQLQLKRNLGLIVDVPKQVSGSSNDGNTARRFFKNWKSVADITGVNQDLLYRFYIILQVLSCGEKIDPSKFESFTLATANIFVNMYGWFYMPSSIHKILIHGKTVLNATSLPIGWMSEEAQESRLQKISRV